MRLERLHQEINVLRIDLRLIPLNVDDELGVATAAADDLGNAIGSAGMLARHFDAGAKPLDGGGDFQAVGRHDHFGQRLRPAGLLPGVLQEGFSGLG